MIAVVSIAKKNPAGDILSQRHLLLRGPAPMLDVEGMTSIINVAEFNLSENPKLYTCPRMAREIADVMRDVKSTSFRYAISEEPIEWDMDLDQMVDHTYEMILHREGEDCFCELWADGAEIDQDPDDFGAVADGADRAKEGAISYQDRLALEDELDRPQNATIWRTPKPSGVAETGDEKDVVARGSLPVGAS